MPLSDQGRTLAGPAGRCGVSSPRTPPPPPAGGPRPGPWGGINNIGYVPADCARTGVVCVYSRARARVCGRVRAYACVRSCACACVRSCACACACVRARVSRALPARALSMGGPPAGRPALSASPRCRGAARSESRQPVQPARGPRARLRRSESAQALGWSVRVSPGARLAKGQTRDAAAAEARPALACRARRRRSLQPQWQCRGRGHFCTVTYQCRVQVY